MGYQTGAGGPAFPIPGLWHDESFNGMALRDYFAAKAIPLIAAQADLGNAGTPELAAACYEFADEMLLEREAPQAARIDERLRADAAASRAARYEELLREVLRTADLGDVGQTTELREAIAAAKEALDDDEIAF